MKSLFRITCTLVLILSILSSFLINASAILTIYTFTDINENEISTGSGKKSIVVFGRPGCINTRNTVEAINNSSAFDNVDIIFADIDECSRDTIINYASSFDEGDIHFCYGDYNMMMWNIVWDTNGHTNTISLPVTAVFDENGRAVKVDQGAKKAQYFIDLLSIDAEIDYSKEPYRVSIQATARYDYAKEVVKLVNTERAKKGLPPLELNKSLTEAAMQRSAEIGTYYSHTRPDGSSCFTLFPPQSGAMGENIAIGQGSPESVMYSWMNSEGHRENILYGGFYSIGVGCIEDDNGTLYWVQSFASMGGENGTPDGQQIRKFDVDIYNSYTETRIYFRQQDFSDKDIGKSFACEIYSIDTYINNGISVLPESFIFSSSDPSVATVSSDGTVKILKTGKTVITATAKNNHAKKFSAEIFVENTVSPHNHNYVFSNYITNEYANRVGAKFICTFCDDTLDKDCYMGDADGNGEISAADARLTLRTSVGLESFDGDNMGFMSADMDNNGIITASDARTILRLSVGLPVNI